MFGMGIGEIVVIIVVALLFIGPEKLPEAAKSLSKGIRDIRKQTRELRETIEEDTEFGGAIRDLQSALRGEDQQAVANARRKLAAQKSATPKPEPGASLAADAAAGALAARVTAVGGDAPAAAGDAPTAGTAGTDSSTAPVAGMPVITASAGAVARGTAAPAPEPAGDGAQEPAETKPAPGHAHG